MLDGLVTWLEEAIRAFVNHAGYGAIGILMLLEAMCIPIPSEVTMTLAGVLAKQGDLNLHLAVWAGAIGSAIGHTIAYYAGSRGGRPFLEKYGKFVFIREKEFEHADKWFARYGSRTSFVGRFVPLIRSFISFAMGVWKARFLPFLGLSFLANLIWCYLWGTIGFTFESYREQIKPVMKVLDLVIVLAIAGFAVFWVVRKRRERMNNA